VAAATIPSEDKPGRDLQAALRDGDRGGGSGAGAPAGGRAECNGRGRRADATIAARGWGT
jgi:hypothetical protein